MDKKHTVRTRTEYIVGKPKQVPTVPLDVDLLSQEFQLLADTIDENGEVDLQSLSNVLNLQEARDELQIESVRAVSIGDNETPLGVVVVMDQRGAQRLNAAYQKHLHVEENQLLTYDEEEAEIVLESEWNSGLTPLDKDQVTIIVQGPGSNGSPVRVPNADVYLLGIFSLARGRTDKKGRAVLEIFGDAKSFRALYIKPRDTYWSRWIDSPTIQTNVENEVSLVPLGNGDVTTLQGFPNEEKYGWGQLAMELDKADAVNQGRAQDIKVGIIDAGLDTDHVEFDPGQVIEGMDLTDGQANTSTWNDDTSGHGTHVAGIIGGLRANQGIRGFAPSAKFFIYKVFPGGKIDSLLLALDRCIKHKVDVVNLSLGTSKPNEQLREKIQEARAAGVACIAAAGNSKGTVRFPAAFDEVMAVAAIGKTNTFHPESYHSRQVGEKSSGDYFNGKFICFGNEIDVCAPGVAVVSSVSSSSTGYASWDGTSMACPHVVGLAARTLEGRPEIKNQPLNQRVKSLFDHITTTANATAVANIPDEYKGAGLVNAHAAFGVRVDGDGSQNDHTRDPWKKLSDILQQAVECVKNIRDSKDTQ